MHHPCESLQRFLKLILAVFTRLFRHLPELVGDVVEFFRFRGVHSPNITHDLRDNALAALTGRTRSQAMLLEAVSSETQWTYGESHPTARRCERRPQPSG